MKLFFFLLCALCICSQAQTNFPEWSKGIVWYQIFPERFANGDPSNDPDFRKVLGHDSNNTKWKVRNWTSDWFAQEEYEQKLPCRFRDKLSLRRYGGDIKGIIDRIDYLNNLGVDAIYLNPVFEAVSHHKYDGAYFHHIDVNFGPDPEGDKKLLQSEVPDDISTWTWTSADKLFLQLIRELHKRKMYIVIDGVFNHTGREFFAFNDIVNNGRNSRFSDWYLIKEFDDHSTEKNEFDYKGWWNSKYLPEFNRNKEDLAEGPKQYIFDSVRRWMDPNEDGNPEDGIDGWRLDVARDVPIGFWKEWSKLVKSINPKAYITGELWELSPEFVGRGDVFDALMNYNFAFAVNNFFIARDKKIGIDEFKEKLEEIFNSYPMETCHILMNLLDSHDTDRLSSMILNPDREYDRNASEDNQEYNPAKPGKNVYDYMKLIIAFQMTWLGSPMIYYGDEAGMWGADDPHDRKPMLWDDLIYSNETIDAASGFKKGWGTYEVKADKNLIYYYKHLIKIRKNTPALKYGSVKFLNNENKNLVAFVREYNNSKCFVYINPSEEEIRVKLPSNNLQELLTEKEIIQKDNFILTIAPGSVQILNSPR